MWYDIIRVKSANLAGSDPLCTNIEHRHDAGNRTFGVERSQQPRPAQAVTSARLNDCSSVLREDDLVRTREGTA